MGERWELQNEPPLALKKLIGCPAPPTPNFEKLEKKNFTVRKYTVPNFQNSKKGVFFFVECSCFKFTVLKFLLSICLYLKTGLNLYEEIYW